MGLANWGTWPEERCQVFGRCDVVQSIGDDASSMRGGVLVLIVPKDREKLIHASSSNMNGGEL